MKKLDNETILGGLFGGVAVLAAFIETYFSGFSAESISGLIKDAAGTMVAVMVFIIAIRQWKNRSRKGFMNIFVEGMGDIIKRYNPIVRMESETVYSIADNLDCIVGVDCNSYHRLFELNGRKELEFSVSKTVFMGRSSDDFTETRDKIINQITKKIQNDFSIVEKTTSTDKGIKIYFAEELSTDKDAEELIKLIDSTLLLFVAENKKK